MIDFSALVLAPAMETFARPITITPTISHPDADSYAARGVWTSSYVDVQMEDGSTLSTQNHTLGIRLSEYAIAPVQGDRVEIGAYLSLPRIGVCDISNVQLDGQGGATLVLKVIRP